MCSDSATRWPALRSRRHAPLHPLAVVIAHIAADMVSSLAAPAAALDHAEAGDLYAAVGLIRRAAGSAPAR